MSASLLPLASLVKAFQSHKEAARAGSKNCRLSIATGVATMMLATALLIDRATPVRADDNARASSNAQTQDAGSPSGFVTEIRWKLKQLQDRMIKLATPAVRPVDPTANLRNQFVSLQVDVKSHEMKLENAKFAREIAEIELIEYREGIYVQDKAVLDGARLLAESDLERKRDLLKFARRQFADARSPSKNLPAESARESRAADNVARQEIELRRSELALAIAESKVKNLDGYTRPKRISEIRSKIEKARSNELALQVERELGQSRLRWLTAAIKTQQLPAAERTARADQDRRTRDSLRRAISIEERLQARLGQLATAGSDAHQLRGEIKDLLTELDVLLDQAEAERSADQLDAVKGRFLSST